VSRLGGAQDNEGFEVFRRPEGAHFEAGPINQKKTRRIYRELGLQLRNKTQAS